MKREISTDSFRFWDANTNEDYYEDKLTFCQKYKITSLIRIHEKERNLIDTSVGYFDHFNLEKTGHEIGATYGVICILQGGSFDPTTQQQTLPLLDTQKMIRGKVTNVANHLPFENIPEEIFSYSFPHIQNSEQLFEVLRNRYSSSVVGLTQKKLQELGVARTRVHFI